MEPYEYEAMYRLEDNLWWYMGMRHISDSLFRKFLPIQEGLKILDVGAGSGGSLPLLRPFGEVTAFDFSPMAVRFYRNREAGGVAQASAAAIPFRDHAFDLVTVFDVLATLDNQDEQLALGEIARVLKPGGFLFWREPALMFLYGPHDQATHVHRRYTTGAFRSRLTAQGLQPVRLSYANMLLFPVAAVRRLVAKKLSRPEQPRSDVREVPDPLNAVLTRVLSLEAPLLERAALPIGLSVLTLARKS